MGVKSYSIVNSELGLLNKMKKLSFMLFMVIQLFKTSLKFCSSLGSFRLLSVPDRVLYKPEPSLELLGPIYDARQIVVDTFQGCLQI